MKENTRPGTNENAVRKAAADDEIVAHSLPSVMLWPPQGIPQPRSPVRLVRRVPSAEDHGTASHVVQTDNAADVHSKGMKENTRPAEREVKDKGHGKRQLQPNDDARLTAFQQINAAQTSYVSAAQTSRTSPPQRLWEHVPRPAAKRNCILSGIKHSKSGAIILDDTQPTLVMT